MYFVTIVLMSGFFSFFTHADPETSTNTPEPIQMANDWNIVPGTFGAPQPMPRGLGRFNGHNPPPTPARKIPKRPLISVSGPSVNYPAGRVLEGDSACSYAMGYFYQSVSDKSIKLKDEIRRGGMMGFEELITVQPPAKPKGAVIFASRPHHDPENDSFTFDGGRIELEYAPQKKNTTYYSKITITGEPYLWIQTGEDSGKLIEVNIRKTPIRELIKAKSDEKLVEVKAKHISRDSSLKSIEAINRAGIKRFAKDLMNIKEGKENLPLPMIGRCFKSFGVFDNGQGEVINGEQLLVEVIQSVQPPKYNGSTRLPTSKSSQK